MTDTSDVEDWGPTLEAVGRPLGGGRTRNTRVGLQEIQEAQDFQRERTGADVAVALGGVDTGDGYDGWSHVTEWATDVGEGITDAVTGTANTINAIVQGFTGLIGDWLFPDVESAAEAIARQQAETAASVAKLQQLNSANAQGGNSGFVDFTGLADASTMGSQFDQFYSGAGTDTLGIVGGRTGVVPGTFTADRLCRFVFNAKTTLSDFQRVSMVFATSPGKRSFAFPATQTVYGYNYIRARIAESGTYAGIDCVQVIFDIDSFDLGCVVNGVWTKWITVAHKFRPGAIYSLDAGSTGGNRQYRILLNGANVYVHNEVGTISQLGSGYRDTGGGGAWEAGTDGGTWFRAQPSAIAAFYMADNTPPGQLSSIGRAFRASGTTVSFNTVSTMYTLPANMFDTFDYATPDLVWNGSAGSWTIGRRGNYIVNAHMANNNTTLTGYVALFVNGVQTNSGNVGPFSTLAFAIPLMPGDVLTLGYFTGTANCRIFGRADGDITFFQVVRITPDNLEDISA
ncbi:DUF7257 domain-containing protein [Mycolicibacterium bacteremicum]|uniref:DUF7257 domain-containing protein n=1 Tax=Mycolicibacterium bacteremicum TaxID=564198 RepID=A0A1W9Z0K8_MYCBA|nr:hypothetical protein [Mycolicibacterium bacteremicum]MCV7434807.1 hypothetical protein [Mycolicibacterium bacteremicum]ORA05797.1 hypothetical protein BST17_08555 [Mycolicibacterium bacteremicum]